MKLIFVKAASVLAFAIGALAVFAGGQVLLGYVPGYYVIDWLPLYNFIFGIATFFFTAVVIWKNHKLALPAAIITLGSHTLVMVILLTVYSNVVAPDSLRAMMIRIAVWVIIPALLIIQPRRKLA